MTDATTTAPTAPHRTTDAPWPKLVQFHHELARRQQEDFFAVPAQQPDGKRWSSLNNLGFSAFAGPWTIDESDVRSEEFRREVRSGANDTIFMGGLSTLGWRSPMGFGAKSLIAEWRPVVVREVRIERSGSTWTLVPEVGRWDVSPLVLDFLSRQSIGMDTDIDELFARLIEESSNEAERDGTDLEEAFRKAIGRSVPPLGDEIEKVRDTLPRGIDEFASPWILFSPPESVSAFSQHLMRDYDRMEERLSTDPNDVGGLKLLSEIPEFTESEDVDILPIVPLNESQEKAVGEILLGRPVTVVSGPPGCGKSQVVVSLLLNSWAKGQSVLFASNNNQAVDVVLERLKKFWDRFPVAIRAGAKSKAEIIDSFKQLQTVLQSGKGALKGLSGADDDVQRALGRISTLRSLLESRAPQRMDEQLRAALQACGDYITTAQALDGETTAINDRFTALEFAASAENAWVDAIEPFGEWLAGMPAVNDTITEDERQREVALADRDVAWHDRDKTLGRKHLDASLVRDWRWLATDEHLDRFDAWRGSTSELVSRKIEDEIGPGTWSDEWSVWKDGDSARASVNRSADAAKEIRVHCDESRAVIKRLQDVDANLETAVASLKSHGIDAPPALGDEWSRKWSNAFAESIGRAASWSDAFPWSAAKKIEKRLLEAEAHVRQGVPLDVLTKIGALNQDGRTRLAPIIEAVTTWHQRNQEWEAAALDRDAIDKRAEPLRSVVRTELDESSPSNLDLDVWHDLATTFQERSATATAAAAAWERRVRAEQIATSLGDVARAWRDLADDVPLVREWASREGAAFDTAVTSLLHDPDARKIRDLRVELDRDGIRDLATVWRAAASDHRSGEDAKRRHDAVPTATDRINAWWSNAPTAIGVKAALGRPLPEPGDALYDRLEAARAWHEDWKTFTQERQPSLEAEVKRAVERARKQLSEATERASELLEAGVVDRINTLAAGDPAKWDTEAIAKLFRGARPGAIEAEIAQLESRLERVTFQAACERWVETMKSRPDVLDAVSDLHDHYKKNGLRIEPAFYDRFAKSLEAAPIWITTAQSSQSLAMEPGVFDLLVIDEATQCTLTNLLPLIYRAKRIAVIGDPQQLPAIFKFGIEAERAIARKFDVDGLVDEYGNVENDVYRMGVRCLPGRVTDVISLNEHYRSDPLIIGFSNKHIYQSALTLRKDPDAAKDVPRGAGVHAIKVSGEVRRGPRRRSWVNEPEADAVLDLVSQLQNDPKSRGITIGIVTPFAAHADYIEKALESRGLLEDVTVGTAHRFQGDERDVMILTPVVSTGMTQTSKRWVESPPNLLNVAITRARETLFVVADFDECRKQDGILRDLVKYVEDVELLRKTSDAELELFRWMVLEGWSPKVHPRVKDIEVDFIVTNLGRRLVIEVDGSQHDSQVAQDAGRDAMLQGAGYDVLRVSARDVFETPTVVLEKMTEQLAGA